MASEGKGWVQPSLSACDAYDCHHPSEAHHCGQHHPGAPQAPPRQVTPPKPTLTLASSLTFHTKDSAL